MQFCLLAFLGLLAGCKTISMSPRDRGLQADAIARVGGFSKEIIAADPFTITTYYRIRNKGDALRVYIEGDGFAWASPRRLSSDPTPKNPLGLKLAVQDSYDNVLYMARPGQFSDTAFTVDSQYWSLSRFSPEVLRALSKVIDVYKEKLQPSTIHLVGYSGGGALAALLAANRKDIDSLRTVAGNLDHHAFTEHHGATPLSNSLNPINFPNVLSNIRQVHFIGGADKIIPKIIAESYLAEIGSPKCAELVVVEKATHHQGWAKDWRDLLQLPLPNSD